MSFPRILLAAALSLSAAISARAEIKIQGGPCLPALSGDSWLEAWVELENTGTETVEGRVEAQVIRRSGLSPEARVDLQLAGGSKKRVSLLINISSGGAGRLEFRLVNARGRLLARHDASGVFMGASQGMIVVLPGPDRLPSLAGAYARALGPGARDLVTVENPSRLPEHWPGWMRTEIIVASETDFGLLNDDQKRAIRDWVWMGGVIVFAPGSNPAWLEDPFVQSLAPCGRVEPGPWPAALELALNPDPTLRHSGYRFQHEGTALVSGMDGAGWQWKRGRGVAAVLAFDVNQPLFVARNDRLERFTQRLFIDIAPPAPPRILLDGGRGGYERDAFLEAIGEGLVEYPSTGFLMIGLILYVVLVGPVNFIFLRRRHRSAMTVVTVPLLGLLATGSLVGFRLLLRDRTVRASRITVLQLVPGSGRALATEHVVAICGASVKRRFESDTGRLFPVTNWRNDDARVSAYHGEALAWSLQPQEPVRLAAIGSREIGAARALWDGLQIDVQNETDSDFQALHLFDLKTGEFSRFKGVAKGQRGKIPWKGSGTLTGKWRPSEDWDEKALWALAYAYRTLDGVVLLAVLGDRSPDTRLDGQPAVFTHDATVLILPVEKRK